MTRPVLIGIGGHVIAALVEQLGAVPGLADAVELHLSPEMPGGRPRAAVEVLARAVVVLAENGAMDPAERAALGPDCAVIVLPRLEFASLWPQMAAPFGDRVALGVVRAVAEPGARRAAYDAVALDRLVDLDRMHAFEAREMFRREEGCDIRVAGFVLSRFRAERLFYSAVHPAGALLEQVMAQLLGHPAIRALATAPFDALLRAVVPGLAGVFADAQAPVLPGVAAHFGLAWWSHGLQYRQGAVAHDGAGWVEWHLRAPEGAAVVPPSGMTEPATLLYPAVQVTRVAPFFATAIDPGIARHGAELLSADSGHYAAAAVLLTMLDEAIVLGAEGAVRQRDEILPDMIAGVRINAAAFLGFGPGWADDPHGMIGIVPRLVAYARLRRHDAGLKLLLTPAMTATRLVREMLALLGIGGSDVVELADGMVGCARLGLAGPFDRNAVSPISHAAAQALASLVPLGPEGPRLLYLRSSVTAGRVANDEEVAHVLTRRGYSVVDVDRTSLAERIGLLRAASGLVAAQGPALAELVFCAPGAAVLELVGPANPQTLFWSLASCAGLRYGYVVGEAVGAAGWDGDYVVPAAMLDHAAGVMAQGS